MAHWVKLDPYYVNLDNATDIFFEDNSRSVCVRFNCLERVIADDDTGETRTEQSCRWFWEEHEVAILRAHLESARREVS